MGIKQYYQEAAAALFMGVLAQNGKLDSPAKTEAVHCGDCEIIPIPPKTVCKPTGRCVSKRTPIGNCQFFTPKQQAKKPKWLYRLEYKDNSSGLWYNGKGEWCFECGIGSLGDECKTKTLPMGYDWRYKQDGKDWFSSCSNRDDLLHWYSIDDAKRLLSNGFVFARYLAIDYHEYGKETVFLKETCLDRQEIDFEELFR